MARVLFLGIAGVVLWHLLILARLHSALGNDQILLIASLVNLIPVTAAILLWTRFRKIAGWLLLVSLGIGLPIGTYEHFLSPSPDNIFRMTEREWVLQFRITSSGGRAAQLTGVRHITVHHWIHSGVVKPSICVRIGGLLPVGQRK